jgi:hypothetical protein
VKLYRHRLFDRRRSGRGRIGKNDFHDGRPNRRSHAARSDLCRGAVPLGQQAT